MMTSSDDVPGKLPQLYGMTSSYLLPGDEEQQQTQIS